MSAWFRYERDFAGRWCPVVLYGDKPIVSRHDAERITPAVPVPDECLASDGSPMFGCLQAKFPAPKVAES